MYGMREPFLTYKAPPMSGCDFGSSVDKLHSTSSRLENAEYMNESEMLCSSNSSSGSTSRSFTSEQDAKVNQGRKSVNKEDLDWQDPSKEIPVNAGEVGKFSAHKRSRRPPKRYIEEFTYQKSRCVEGKAKISSKPSRDRPDGTRSQNEHHHVTFGVLTLASGRESTGRASNEAPFDFQFQNEFPKRSASFLERSSDEDATAIESEDSHVMAKKSAGIGDRRKHQRLWTLSEVMKLVDGVSQHGVGRWTEIKRLLFSSSTYRTPIDLRDKWRNLIKASHAKLRKRREVGQRRTLPDSLLRRVSELAAGHPCPRDRKSKPCSRVSQGTEFDPGSMGRATELSPGSHVKEFDPGKMSRSSEFNPGRIPVKLY